MYKSESMNLLSVIHYSFVPKPGILVFRESSRVSDQLTHKGLLSSLDVVLKRFEEVGQNLKYLLPLLYVRWLQQHEGKKDPPVCKVDVIITRDNSDLVSWLY